MNEAIVCLSCLVVMMGRIAVRTPHRQCLPLADVAPLRRSQWFPTLVGGDFKFYLEAVDSALSQMTQDDDSRVALVGHSAGGFLARILLGDVKYQGKSYARANRVHTLVTLGSPHLSREKYPCRRVPERLDIENPCDEIIKTSTLQFANHFYQRGDCFPGVRTVCVAGNAITGESPFALGHHIGVDPSTAISMSSRRSVLWSGIRVLLNSSQSRQAYWAYVGYASGCLHGDVPGDGVTPVEIAHLPGAIKIELPDIWHGPPLGRIPWYGSVDAVNAWVDYLEEGLAGDR